MRYSSRLGLCLAGVLAAGGLVGVFAFGASLRSMIAFGLYQFLVAFPLGIAIGSRLRGQLLTATVISILLGNMVFVLSSGVHTALWVSVSFSIALSAVIALVPVRGLPSSTFGHYRLTAWPRSLLWTGVILAMWTGLMALRTMRTSVEIEDQRAVSDQVVFEVISNALAGQAWTTDGFISGVPVRYHTLAYKLVGVLTGHLGFEAFEIQSRLLPALMAVCLVLLLGGWAQQISSVGWAAPIAATLTLAADVVSLPHLAGMHSDLVRVGSASATVGAALSAMFCWIVFSLLRNASRWAPIVALASGIVLTPTKMSLALVVVAPPLAMLGTAVSRRQIHSLLLPLASLVAALAGSGLAYWQFIYGQSAGVYLDPFYWLSLFRGSSAVSGSLVAVSVSLAVVTYVSFLPRVSGLLGLSYLRDPEVKFLGGTVMIVASIPFLLVDPLQLDRGWIFIGALPVLTALAAAGLALVWMQFREAVNPLRLFVSMMIAALVCVALSRLEIAYAMPLMFSLLFLCAALCVVLFGWAKSERSFKSTIFLVSVPLTAMSIILPFLIPGYGAAAIDQEAERHRVVDGLSETATQVRAVMPAKAVIATTGINELLTSALTNRPNYTSDQYLFMLDAAGKKEAKRRSRVLEELVQSPTFSERAFCAAGIDALWGAHLDRELWPEPRITSEASSVWIFDCKS